MAFRTWARILLAAFGVGALAGASQLGVAYGLGVVRLTRIFDVTTRDQWTAQLAWVAWFPVVAAVIGALVARRLVPRWVDPSMQAARTSDDPPSDDPPSGIAGVGDQSYDGTNPARMDSGSTGGGAAGRVAEGGGPAGPADPPGPAGRASGPDAPGGADDPATRGLRVTPEVRNVGWSVATSIAAGLGAAIVVPLTMQPARTAQVAGVDPVFVIAVCATLGAAIGTCAGLAALMHPVARRSVTVVVAAVWAIALISLAPSLGLADRLPAVRLGVFDAAFMSPATTQRTALFTMPALALLSGAALGWVARREGRTPVTVALAGLPGPLLLTLTYLIAGPGNGAERYQLVPYWAATAATFAGILGSALAAVLRRNDGAAPPADRGTAGGAAEPTLAPAADRPPLPRRRAGSAEPAVPASATTDVPPEAQAPRSGTDPGRFDSPAYPDRPTVTGLDVAEPDPRDRGRSAYGPVGPRQPVVDPPGYLQVGVVPSAPAHPDRDRPAGTRPGDSSFFGARRAPVELPDTPAPAPFDGFSPADTGSLRRDHPATRTGASGDGPLRFEQGRIEHLPPTDNGPADTRPAGLRPADIRPADLRPADIRPADAPSGTVRSGDSGPVQGRADDRGHPWARRDGGRHGAPSAAEHPTPAEEDRSAAVHDVPRPATSPYIATPVTEPPVPPARSSGGVLGRLPKLGFGRDSRRTDEPAPDTTASPAERPAPPEPATLSSATGTNPFSRPPSTGPAPEPWRPRVSQDPPEPARRIAQGPRPEPAHPTAQGPRPNPAHPLAQSPRPEPEPARPTANGPRPEPVPEPPRATPTMARTRPPTRVGPVPPEPQPVSAPLPQPSPIAPPPATSSTGQPAVAPPAPADPPEEEAPTGRRASRNAALRPQDEEYVDWVSRLGSD